MSVNSIFFFIAVIFASTWAQIPEEVIVLEGADVFEHTTQVSTGQTAGVWFILFNDATYHRAGQAHELWQNLAADPEKEVIVGEVFLEKQKNRPLAFQFIDLQPPVAVLFRDQKMYIFPESLYKEDSLDKLKEFWNDGYMQVAPVSVPPPNRRHKEMQQNLLNMEKGGGSNFKVGLGGVAALIVAFAIKTWIRNVATKNKKAAADAAAAAKSK